MRELYRTLEFSSLLRELAPAAKSVIETDYQRLDPAQLDAWLQALPADAPVAVAAGEMMTETVLAFSARHAEARYVTLENIPARANAACDIKALIRRFGDAPHLIHDVMLYGFLIAADPARCDVESLAERYLDREVSRDPAGEADAALTHLSEAAPGGGSAGPGSRCMNRSTSRWCACWRAWKIAESASIPISSPR